MKTYSRAVLEQRASNNQTLSPVIATPALILARKNLMSEAIINGGFYIGNTNSIDNALILSPTNNKNESGSVTFFPGTTSGTGGIYYGTGSSRSASNGWSLDAIKKGGVFMNGYSMIFENYHLAPGHNLYYLITGSACNLVYDLTMSERS